MAARNERSRMRGVFKGLHLRTMECTSQMDRLLKVYNIRRLILSPHMLP
jgi:hypothetical protein